MKLSCYFCSSKTLIIKFIFYNFQLPPNITFTYGNTLKRILWRKWDKRTSMTILTCQEIFLLKQQTMMSSVLLYVIVWWESKLSSNGDDSDKQIVSCSDFNALPPPPGLKAQSLEQLNTLALVPSKTSRTGYIWFYHKTVPQKEEKKQQDEEWFIEAHLKHLDETKGFLVSGMIFYYFLFFTNLCLWSLFVAC